MCVATCPMDFYFFGCMALQEPNGCEQHGLLCKLKSNNNKSQTKSATEKK